MKKITIFIDDTDPKRTMIGSGCEPPTMDLELVYKAIENLIDGIESRSSLSKQEIIDALAGKSTLNWSAAVGNGVTLIKVKAKP